KLAKSKWPKPWGFVLPVMIEPTDIRLINPYLAAATILEPKGDVALEVVSAVRRMPQPARRGDGSSKMIDVATATHIASLASEAVQRLDMIYRSYFDVMENRDPHFGGGPPSLPQFVYVNSPQHSAIVAQSPETGEKYQTVTYQELCNRLKDNDRRYIEV